MRFLCKSLILVMSIATLWSADKDRTPFRPPAADQFPNHQKIRDVIIAADAYATKEETKTAFGKLNPNEHGILPVLVVIQNESSAALRMDGMRVEYIRPDRRRIENTPPEDLPYLRGAENPQRVPSPVPRNPIPGLGGKKKNALAAWEIEGRAFANKMIPPRDSAHGFFYFNTADHRGAILYITGIREAATGQELFFFEIPLE